MFLAVMAVLGLGSTLTFIRMAEGAAPLLTSERLPGAILAARTPCPWISVTFDDGPHATLTPAVLDTLEEFGARATFYVVGSEVEQRPEIVRRAAAEGHEIANHTWSHGDLLDRNAAEIRIELRRTDLAIRRTGVTPAAQVRPPRGRLDPVAGTTIERGGWQTVLWNASTDPLTRAGLTPEQAARRVAGPMGPGAIVLLHDGGPIGARSVTALRPLLEALRVEGLQSVPVGELLASAVTGRCDA
jgi:peptidoglycan-N-acetylglucosamine deacetylase